MGSSCFTRGNRINAEIIDRFIHESNLSAQVTITGCLCAGHCKGGPVIIIDGQLYTGMEPGMLLDMLKHRLGTVQA